MKKMSKKILFALPLALVMLLLGGCTLRIGKATFGYTFTGASISDNARTFSVAYFPNNAAMVAPVLSSTLTDALRERFSRQTRLSQIQEGGDLAVEGEITNYVSAPSSYSSAEGGVAEMNRLTVTVQVRFTNAIEPQWNYNKSFSASRDYSASQLLQEVEGALIQEMVSDLVDDIFNACVSNW